MRLPRQLPVLSVLLSGWLCSMPSPRMLAAGEQHDLDRLYSYFVDNLAGRRLEMTTTAVIAGGKVESEFHRRRTFTNLMKSANGFAFDVVAVIAQKNYDRNEAGERLPNPPQIKDRVVVVRYKIKKSVSSGELIGIAEIVLNTEQDPTAGAKSVRVHLAEEKLIVKTKDVLYADHFAPSGGRKPGVGEITEEYWTVQGKLRGKTTDKSVEVDPRTLELVGEPTVNVAEEREAK